MTSPQQRIPRPRHLFPEVAAWLIESRRTGLRTSRLARQVVGRIPVWTVAAAAGVTAMMLAVLLFFLAEPAVVATPLAAVELAPTPAPQLVTIEPKTPVMRSSLQASLDWTRPPANWDQERVVTLSAAQRVQPVGNVTFEPPEPWKSTGLVARAIGHFEPYSPELRPTPLSSGAIVSSDTIESLLPPIPDRELAITVNSSAPQNGVSGEPLTYAIRLRNSSNSDIEDLTVREEISAIHRVVNVTPDATIEGNEIVWHLDRLAGGADMSLQVTLIPDETTEIHTRTTVLPVSRVSAAAMVRPRPSKLPDSPPAAPPFVQEAPRAPELRLSFTPIGPLRQGEALSTTFAVTNVGNAPARDVQLFARLSPELEHREGPFVKHAFDRLEPGQTRRALFQARAVNGGAGTLNVTLTMQGATIETRELRIPIRAREPEVARRPASRDASEIRLSFDDPPPVRSSEDSD